MLSRLLAASVVAVSLLAAVGCSSPPDGVLARKTETPAEARLLPPGPVGAMGEIGLSASSAPGAFKVVNGRGFSITDNPDGSQTWTLDLSDHPSDRARARLVLSNQGGRMYIVGAEFTVKGPEVTEQWTMADSAVEDGSSATLHVDADGRSHLTFRVTVVSEQWPEPATLNGVVISTK